MDGSKFGLGTRSQRYAMVVEDGVIKQLFVEKPGAYTRTCSSRHLPGYVSNAAALQKKGIDAVACLSVNDAFVMGAWGKDQKADGKVMMLADGNGDFTKAVDLELDARANGLGIRSKRYAMVVDNGVVKTLNVENPGAFEVSSAEAILKAL